jgi:hypothetical protein
MLLALNDCVGDSDCLQNCYDRFWQSHSTGRQAGDSAQALHRCLDDLAIIERQLR